jgi:hypothetical protein
MLYQNEDGRRPGQNLDRIEKNQPPQIAVSKKKGKSGKSMRYQWVSWASQKGKSRLAWASQDSGFNWYNP